MRKKNYPRLTHDNAEFAAKIYMRMKNSSRFIWRTTDFTENSRTRDYKSILQALHRLLDNRILGSTTVGDAGNIWYLKERTIEPN